MRSGVARPPTSRTAFPRSFLLAGAPAASAVFSQGPRRPTGTRSLPAASRASSHRNCARRSVSPPPLQTDMTVFEGTEPSVDPDGQHGRASGGPADALQAAVGRQQGIPRGQLLAAHGVDHHVDGLASPCRTPPPPRRLPARRPTGSPGAADRAKYSSAALSQVCRISTRTWPGPGTGSGACPSRSPPGAPGADDQCAHGVSCLSSHHGNNSRHRRVDGITAVLCRRVVRCFQHLCTPPSGRRCQFLLSTLIRPSFPTRTRQLLITASLRGVVSAARRHTGPPVSRLPSPLPHVFRP